MSQMKAISIDSVKIVKHLSEGGFTDIYLLENRRVAKVAKDDPKFNDMWVRQCLRSEAEILESLQ